MVSADNHPMSPDRETDETCHVCGKDPAAGNGFCHVFHEGNRVSLCGPPCVDTYQRRRAGMGEGRPRQSFLEQLVEELRWRSPEA